MHQNAVGPSNNSLVWVHYIRVDFNSEWSIFVRKAALAVALLAGLLLGGEDLVTIFKQLLN